MSSLSFHCPRILSHLTLFITLLHSSFIPPLPSLSYFPYPPPSFIPSLSRLIPLHPHLPSLFLCISLSPLSVPYVWLVSFGALHEVSVAAAKAGGKSGARTMQGRKRNMPVSCMLEAQRLSSLQHILQHRDAATFLRQCVSASHRASFLSLSFTEFKYFRDGATLVISLDGLNWLSKRRCNDKEVKKRYYLFFVFLSLWLVSLSVWQLFGKVIIIRLFPEPLHLLHNDVLIYLKQGGLDPSRPPECMCVFLCVWKTILWRMCVCVCVCVLSHPLRHSCCESAPLFLSWVTHLSVAWLLQSGESFLLRLCLRGWMGPDIYSGSGVSGPIMYVSVCTRALVCAPFHPLDKGWQISFSTFCCERCALQLLK